MSRRSAISFSIFLTGFAHSLTAVAEEPDAAPVVESKPLVMENSLKMCKDGKDNDGDAHIDCDDQDCQIYAICVPSPQETAAREASATPSSAELSAEEAMIVRPVSIGLFPGVTTDGGADGIVKNRFTLNFLGMGDALSGAEFSMLGAIRRYDVFGFQGAPLFNLNLGLTRGFQGAGLFNVSKEGFAGFQGSGIASLTMGRFAGVQGSGIFNLSRDLAGFQGAGIGNVALGDVNGFQGTGIVNVGLGIVNGFQGAGIVNVAGAQNGFQGAGIANISLGSSRGFQGAGIANVTHGDAAGFQGAGIANVTTGQFTGAQLGLINIGTRVKGAQIGLINIATKEMKGASIGLINYAGDGIFAPTFWMSDSSMLNLGLKMGSRHVYGILGGGGHPVENKRASIIGGIGGHIELPGDFWIEIDVLHHAMFGEGVDWEDVDTDILNQVRTNLGYRFANQFSVYLGPSLNVLVSDVRKDVGIIPAFYTNEREDTNVALSVGLTAGIQWEPHLGRLNTRE